MSHPDRHDITDDPEFVTYYRQLDATFDRFCRAQECLDTAASAAEVKSSHQTSSSLQVLTIPKEQPPCHTRNSSLRSIVPCLGQTGVVPSSTRCRSIAMTKATPSTRCSITAPTPSCRRLQT
jgi:hypothetical protein